MDGIKFGVEFIEIVDHQHGVRTFWRSEACPIEDGDFGEKWSGGLEPYPALRATQRDPTKPVQAEEFIGFTERKLRGQPTPTMWRTLPHHFNDFDDVRKYLSAR